MNVREELNTTAVAMYCYSSELHQALESHFKGKTQVVNPHDMHSPGGAENAGVENAGVENVRADRRSGKCGSGKCESR